MTKFFWQDFDVCFLYVKFAMFYCAPIVYARSRGFLLLENFLDNIYQVSSHLDLCQVFFSKFLNYLKLKIRQISAKEYEKKDLMVLKTLLLCHWGLYLCFLSHNYITWEVRLFMTLVWYQSRIDWHCGKTTPLQSKINKQTYYTSIEQYRFIS